MNGILDNAGALSNGDTPWTECILNKYPKLKYLEIRCKNINFMDALKSFQHTLEFISSELVTIVIFGCYNVMNWICIIAQT